MKVRFLLRSALSCIGFLLGYALLGTDGSLGLTGKSLLLNGILLFIIGLGYACYSTHLKTRYGKKVLVIGYILIFLCISLYLFFLRVFLSNHFFSIFMGFVGIIGVLPLPGPAPSSGSESDSASLTTFYYDPEGHSGPSAGSNSISVSVGSIGNAGHEPILEGMPIPLLNGDVPLNGNPPENNVPMGAILDHHRHLNLANELELFARIQLLENRMLPRLPPQLNAGEYKDLVRGFLNEAISPRSYDSTLSHEIFEITILEKKADIVDGVSSIFINETPERFNELLNTTSLTDRLIKEDALDFVDYLFDKFNLTNPRSNFDRRVNDYMLEFWKNDIALHGNQSFFYTEFIKYHSLD